MWPGLAFLVFKTGSYYVAMTELELMLRNLPLVAGIKVVCLRTWSQTDFELPVLLSWPPHRLGMLDLCHSL